MPTRSAFAGVFACAIVPSAFAGDLPVTIGGAQRALNVRAQAFQEGEVYKSDDPVSASTDTLGWWEREASAGGPNLFSSAGHASNIIVGNAITVHSTGSVGGSIFDSPQFQSEIIESNTLLELSFNVTDAVTFSLNGFFEGSSAKTGGFDSVIGSLFEASLVGPGGDVERFEYRITDLPFDPGSTAYGGAILIDASGDLEPGAYTLRIASDITASASGSTFGGPGGGISHDLTFQLAPTPSALALLTIAPLITRRRR